MLAALFTCICAVLAIGFAALLIHHRELEYSRWMRFALMAGFTATAILASITWATGSWWRL